MTVAYTEEALLAQLDTGSGNWGAEWNSILDNMDHSMGLVAVTAGEAISAGEVCYIKPADNKAWLADASALSTLPSRGVAQTSVSAEQSVQLRFFGYEDYSLLSPSLSATSGDILYVSETAGRLTTIAPALAQIFGFVKSDTVANVTRIVVWPRFTINSNLQIALVPVEDLAEAADISGRPILVHPQKIELVSIGVLTQGTPTHPVSPSTSMTITIKDDATNVIVTKDYTNGAPMPDTDFADLGALNATHKILSAAEHVVLDLTQHAGTNIPAFTLVFAFRLLNA